MHRSICLTTVIAATFAVCAHAQPSSPQAAPPAFDVASIRPSSTPQGRGLPSLREDITTADGNLTMRNVTLNTAIRWAYKLNVYAIQAPANMADARYDILGKAGAPASEDQLRVMLQSLLKDRFKLAFHMQPQDLSGFAMVVSKRGAKLTAAAGGGEGSMTGAALVFEGHKMPLSRLADIISSALKLPVLDKTGLDGYYDFKVDLRPYLLARQNDAPGVTRDTPGVQNALVDIATVALEDQLGLKLEERKVRLDMLVVDSVEKTPEEN